MTGHPQQYDDRLQSWELIENDAYEYPDGFLSERGA